MMMMSEAAVNTGVPWAAAAGAIIPSATTALMTGIEFVRVQV
jgi:hypothetical protein